MEPVLIPDLLNIHVVGSMLDLILHTDDRPSFAKTDAEQAGKLRDHKHCIFITFSLDHPSNRLQCIIKEMRIDLRL